MTYKSLLITLLLLNTNIVLAEFPDDFSNVVWLNPDISNWAETSVLNVGFNGNNIVLDHSKANSWPATRVWSCSCNGNAWVFTQRGDLWYAATFEWLRFGQTVKNAGAVNGSHVKSPPIAKDWQPTVGETYGFMVSGLIRNSSFRNVSERSNIVMVEWPKDFPQVTGGGSSSTDPDPEEEEESYTPPDLPETPPFEENKTCNMVLCLIGEIRDEDGGKACKNALKDFTKIKAYDGTGISIPKTIRKRYRKLKQCPGVDNKDIDQIITTYGAVIRL